MAARTPAFRSFKLTKRFEVVTNLLKYFSSILTSLVGCQKVWAPECLTLDPTKARQSRRKCCEVSTLSFSKQHPQLASCKFLNFTACTPIEQWPVIVPSTMGRQRLLKAKSLLNLLRFGSTDSTRTNDSPALAMLPAILMPFIVGPGFPQLSSRLVPLPQYQIA